MNRQNLKVSCLVVICCLFTANYSISQKNFLFSKTSLKEDLAFVPKLSNNCILEIELLKEVENNAGSDARAILEMGRKMALVDKAIVKGTCWTYINAVFKRAGYDKEKHIVFRSKKSGPYVSTDSIKPGDWLYYINHAYHSIDHSGIFVRWVDKQNKIGLVLSYVGRYRKKPGRYKEYNLKDVFFITRAGKREKEESLIAKKL